MNILDYIDWRGDLSFEQSGFNEVDNLIFSTLVYLNMDGLVSEDDSLSPTVAQLEQLYAQAGYDQSHLVNDPRPLLEKAARSQRFGNVIVKRFVNKVSADEQIQFAAVTFDVTERLSYIAFRGTDNTIVGWREDCNLSFLSETPGQREAMLYVNKAAQMTTADLIVGGHSKGGNFAVYAAAFCDKDVSESRIIRVYSNDGPGFNDEIVSRPEYLSVLGKTEKIIPDSSLIGILLSSKAAHKIIKSDAKGVMQHNPYSWCVIGTQFETADERTGTSIFLDETLSSWIGTLSDENKRSLVNAVFDALEASGATTLSEISSNKLTAYNAILKAVSQIDPEHRSDILESLKKLFLSGKDAAKAEYKGLLG